MSTLRLKAGKNFVPQGMPYTDPRTGKQFCGYQLSVDGAINAIIEHRQRNPRHYPPTEFQWFSPTLVRQEFLRHIHSKSPFLFVDGPVPPTNPIQRSGPPVCACGGTEFDVTYCPTCGGSRVNGYRCKKCGKLYDL